MKRANKTPTVKNVFRIIKNVLFAVILTFLMSVVVLTFITKISGKTPFVFGYSLQRVSSESMKPTLEVGDIILCKQCDPMTLKNGDIITYEGKKGQFRDKLVTHRVIKEPYEENGEYMLLTKGDDNPDEDSAISVNDVVGIYTGKADILRPLFEFFVTPWGLLVMIALIILAFLEDIIIFVKALLGIDTGEKKDVDEIIRKYRDKSPAPEGGEDTGDTAAIDAVVESISDESDGDNAEG